MKNTTKAIGMALILGATSATAAPLTIPNTFTAATPIVAADVNANFSATATSVNDIETRLAALEAANTPPNMVSVKGTWAFSINYFQSKPRIKNAQTMLKQGVDISNEIDRGTMVLNGSGGMSGSVAAGYDINTFIFSGQEYVSAAMDLNKSDLTLVPKLYFPVNIYHYPTLASNLDSSIGGGLAGSYTVSVGNAISITMGGQVFTGHISQNGQMAVLHSSNSILHENNVLIAIKISN